MTCGRDSWILDRYVGIVGHLLPNRVPHSVSGVANAMQARALVAKKIPDGSHTGLTLFFQGFLPQQLSNHYADVKQNCYDYEDEEHRVKLGFYG